MEAAVTPMPESMRTPASNVARYAECTTFDHTILVPWMRDATTTMLSNPVPELERLRGRRLEARTGIRLADG